jgi:uncharacterized protein (DUF952 family)
LPFVHSTFGSYRKQKVQVKSSFLLHCSSTSADVQYSSEHHFLGKVAGLLLLFSGKRYSDSCNYLDKAAGKQASFTTIFMAVGGSY